MKTLSLTFKGSLGKSHVLKLNYVKDGLDKDTLITQMVALAKSNAFQKDGENIYAVPVSAKYIKTTEEVIVSKDDTKALKSVQA